MGGGHYNVSRRSVSASTKGYATKSREQIFSQSVERKVHESMKSQGIVVRESCDSDEHPNTVPIILGLDFTGSMGHIPHELIKEGLPELMGGIIQNGVKDPQLLFLGIGDHEYDKYPLQVGQFESSDETLDMWLERSYLEGGGGGNAGESYLLAWYFAAFHTSIESFSKRGKKGFLFTVGDEANLKTLPATAVKEIMGSGQKNYTADELLDAASKMYNVYHIHIDRGGWREQETISWKQTLGENCIVTQDYTEVPTIIRDIIVNNSDTQVPTTESETTISDDTSEASSDAVVDPLFIK